MRSKNEEGEGERRRREGRVGELREIKWEIPDYPTSVATKRLTANSSSAILFVDRNECQTTGLMWGCDRGQALPDHRRSHLSHKLGDHPAAVGHGAAWRVRPTPHVQVEEAPAVPVGGRHVGVCALEGGRVRTHPLCRFVQQMRPGLHV
eukprot:6209754-Pleurochrysis_carterae.AAC.3